MMPTLFLIVSLVGAWLTFNAYNPMIVHRRRSIISFFADTKLEELEVHRARASVRARPEIAELATNPAALAVQVYREHPERSRRAR